MANGVYACFSKSGTNQTKKKRKSTTIDDSGEETRKTDVEVRRGGGK